METDLDLFLTKIKDLHNKPKREILAYFAYFLTVQRRQAVLKPSELARCFDDSAIPGFANIYLEMDRSALFVKTKNGWLLRREVRERIAEALNTNRSSHPMEVGVLAEAPKHQNLSAPSNNTHIDTKSKNVFVVYGRDRNLNDAMFNLLRSLGLNPVEWSEAAKATGEASPTNLQIVEAGFAVSQAALVMFTPDEVSTLRDDLQQNSGDSEANLQSRPNVYFEAGIAITLFPKRTVLVEVGAVREVSDLSGKNSIRINPGPEWRHALAERLRTAGCDVKQTGTHWLTVGDFSIKSKPKRNRR